MRFGGGLEGSEGMKSFGRLDERGDGGMEGWMDGDIFLGCILYKSRLGEERASFHLFLFFFNDDIDE